MARKKKLNKGLAIFCGILFLLIGLCAGVVLKIYLNGNESYYIPEKEVASTSISSGNIDANVIKNRDLSIHFLELGNVYTGDCTLIKVGNTEILIDAGSRANSVSTIYEYVSNYIEDGVLEYAIVTHAHQDHYAGFATGENVDSLFDLLNTRTVIKFSKTNQKDTAKLYSNFKRELEETQTKNGTKVFDALQCYNNETEGAQREYDLGNGVSLEILKHTYYETKATTENNYSVCCMINQNDKNYYLFTGDLESNGESSLVDTYYQENGKNLPEVVLYKAGHHGSKTSSSDKLLNIVKPKNVCVCCCAGSSEYTAKNENQFPTQAFIDRIAPHTKNIFVTTLCIDYEKASYESFNGNIVVSASSDNLVYIDCAKNGNILFKDSEWFKANRTCPDEWKTA